MELRYESTIDDVCEPHIRHYLRSRTYARQRWTAPIWAGVGGMVGFHAVMWLTGRLPDSWAIYCCVFLIGWIFMFITLPSTVSSRIRKHLVRQVGHKLPSTTRYWVSGSKLHCASLGAEFVFDLNNLSAIREDAKRMEVGFGDVGFCVIPLRAFQDEDHKAMFLQSLEKGKDASAPAVDGPDCAP